MKNPIVTPRPQGRVTALVEHFLHGGVWTVQAAAAALYLSITAQPVAWQKMYAKDHVGTVLLGPVVLCMAFLWAVSLASESRRFYDRQYQRLLRKAGLLGHAGVLLIAAATAAEEPNRIGLWIALAMTAFSAVATWAVWMQTRYLPDEDQAVIDALLSREATERAAAHDASEREHRRARLNAIVGSLGYALTDTPAQASEPADPPAVKWTVPAGKHAPLVYFIRNGNRVKIGTTTELKRRIRTLALRPENVTLLVDGGQSREREYHKQFAEHRIGNTEWFAHEGALTDYVHSQLTQISQKGQEQ